MNELAREVLVDAALRGVRQIKGAFHDKRGGSCAAGVLHQALPEHSASHRCHACHGVPIGYVVREAYKLSFYELGAIYTMNDTGADFLTIARKVGVREEGS